MQKIVIINQSGRSYLFAVPKNGYVDKGDRVLVDTRYGEREGVAAQYHFVRYDGTMGQEAEREWCEEVPC